MMMKPERFTAGVFTVVVMALMLSAFYSFATRKLIHNPNANRPKTIAIDWEQLYPFEEGKREFASKVLSLYDYLKDRIEQYTSTNLPCYYDLTDAAKKYENALGWNMVSVSDYNAVVKLRDGYLTTYTMSLDVAPDAESVKDFADFCAERGIDFAYINFPTKVCVSEDRDISGVLDFANQNADRFLAMLRDSGVRCYDFREALHAAGMKHHEAFYITDHHWKAETGLWAAGKVLEILRDDLGWNVEPEIIAPENFEYVVYRDWFLGSQGKKVTLARTKPDDFTMIYPKFETSLKFEVASLGLDLSGDFGITYDMKQVETLDYYGKDPYTTYIYADNPLTRIENKLNTNGKRLLIVKDSFSNCLIPFIALELQYVDVIDLRHFTGSIRNFVDKERPDAVIVEYHSTEPGRTSQPSPSETDKKLYDFR